MPIRPDTEAISSAEAKVFVISAIVLSASVANAAFWYGVFDRVFFTHLLYVWIVATAALLASFFIPRIESSVATWLPWRGRFLLALPTAWLIFAAFIDVETYRPDSLVTWAVWVITILSAFLTLPYLLYVIIVAAVPNVEKLTHNRLRLGLLGIVFVMGLAGFVLGKNHYLFLTCANFKTGGHDIPADCRDQLDRYL